MRSSNTIVNQLNDIYYEHEWWIPIKVDKHTITDYHTEMLNRGNIYVTMDDDKLVGYCETLRINYEQLGRLVLNQEFPVFHEDTINGNVACVNNVWIHPEYRRGSVVKKMKIKWYEDNGHCDYYVGHAQRKQTGLWKSFTKDKLVSTLLRGE